MNISFDIQLKPMDLYRFNIRQTYTSMQGPISIILGILAFVMSGIAFYNASIFRGIVYLLVGVLFIVYIPLSLWLRANKVLRTNSVLAGVLHYTVSEKGIEVAQGEETGELPWDYIYKMISTKKQVLIYSNRVNAYIIPIEQLGDSYEPLKEIAQQKLEKYRIRIK